MKDGGPTNLFLSYAAIVCKNDLCELAGQDTKGQVRCGWYDIRLPGLQDIVPGHKWDMESAIFISSKLNDLHSRQVDDH